MRPRLDDVSDFLRRSVYPLKSQHAVFLTPFFGKAPCLEAFWGRGDSCEVRRVPRCQSFEEAFVRSVWVFPLYLQQLLHDTAATSLEDITFFFALLHDEDAQQTERLPAQIHDEVETSGDGCLTVPFCWFRALRVEPPRVFRLGWIQELVALMLYIDQRIAESQRIAGRCSSCQSALWGPIFRGLGSRV